MNRYPLWKYILIAVALTLGLLYTLPNFFGEAPAVQVSSVKATVKVDVKLLGRVEETLKAANIAHQGLFADQNSVRARFGDTETQIKAKDAIEKALNPDPNDAVYVVALNLLSRSPAWLTSMHALPMYLGLDLRGGVHFLLQVDMKAALDKAADRYSADLRSLLRKEKIQYSGIAREGGNVVMRFKDDAERNKARVAIEKTYTDLAFREVGDAGDLRLIASLKPEAQKRIQDGAVAQNIQILRNRVNELGVAEPIIQQQGAERVVVQLPGVQDTARAKDILGRTATLEVRMVNEEPGSLEQALAGQVPLGSDLYTDRNGTPVVVKRQVVLTGDRINDAQPGFDQRTNEPIISFRFNQSGARKFAKFTQEHVGEPFAIVLDDKVISAPVIREAILGGTGQISGSFTVESANNLAIQLRSGALPAKLTIVEERTVGPSLGADSIASGKMAALVGTLLVTGFMVFCYGLFGVFAVIAVAINIALIAAVMSLMGSTLTLPGIAGLVLNVGMAVDANVLIYERIREELRNGRTPIAAIDAGFERAFATIFDANLTHLIASLVMFWLGSGPVRGFAVTLAIGILTTLFTAFTVTRLLVSWWLSFQGRKVPAPL